MKVHVIEDPWGEWCELWVDGELKEQGHSLRSDWLLELLEKAGVEVTEEEKCLDDCHGDCECPKTPVKLYESASNIGGYVVYHAETRDFLGYTDSEFDGCMKYDKNGKLLSGGMIMDVIEVIED